MNLLSNINQTMNTLIQTVQQSVVRVGNGRIKNPQITQIHTDFIFLICENLR
ncbi:MAG: hypothetical protein KC445_15675 [Anaerolineales bacterium]|nr:hypothetical protein [Anaerolineales bacterium]